MTREEAIAFFKDMNECTYGNLEAVEMAIKALEQTSILDKIRAEIESQREEASKKHSENDELQAFYNGLNDGLKDARDIIDQYKAETEVDNEH